MDINTEYIRDIERLQRSYFALSKRADLLVGETEKAKGTAKKLHRLNSILLIALIVSIVLHWGICP